MIKLLCYPCDDLTFPLFRISREREREWEGDREKGLLNEHNSQVSEFFKFHGRHRALQLVIYIKNIVCLCITLFLCQIILLTHEPLHRFASNFEWGTK